MLGTLLDGIHVYGDVESYPDPLLGRWAWFVPLEFGLAGALAGALIPALERLVGPPRPPRWPLGVRVAELCLIVAAYLSTVVLDDAPVLVTAGPRRPAGDPAHAPARAAATGLYALIGAVAGPVAEATISALGAFDYADPDCRRHSRCGCRPCGPTAASSSAACLAPVVLESYRSRSSTSPPSVPT